MGQDDRLPSAWRQTAERNDNWEPVEVRSVAPGASKVGASDVPGRAARASATPALHYHPPLQVTQEVIAAGLNGCRWRHRGQRVGDSGLSCARITGQQRSQLNQRPVVSLV